jgi:hypothetical protein
MNIWDDLVQPILVAIIWGVLLFLGIWGLIMYLAWNADTQGYTTLQSFYAREDVLDRHSITHSPSNTTQPEGSISGQANFFLFLGDGNIKASYGNSDVLKFNWISPDGYETSSIVSYQSIKWNIIDDSNEPPSFEFVFLDSHLESYFFKNGDRVRESLQLINYNSVFEEAEGVIIHISREDYNRDILCPVNPTYCPEQ